MKNDDYIVGDFKSDKDEKVRLHHKPKKESSHAKRQFGFW